MFSPLASSCRTYLTRRPAGRGVFHLKLGHSDRSRLTSRNTFQKTFSWVDTNITIVASVNGEVKSIPDKNSNPFESSKGFQREDCLRPIEF